MTIILFIGTKIRMQIQIRYNTEHITCHKSLTMPISRIDWAFSLKTNKYILCIANRKPQQMVYQFNFRCLQFTIIIIFSIFSSFFPQFATNCSCASLLSYHQFQLIYNRFDWHINHGEKNK